jgi:hypothetical protein
VDVSTFTLLDDGRPVEVPARLGGEHVRLTPAAVERALGWSLRPEGLCRGTACIPLPAGSPAADPDGLDLAELAALLARPLALDVQERAAYLGVAAPQRSAALASLEAPDFALPDLGGRLHRLSEHRGAKVLLVAYASW